MEIENVFFFFLDLRVEFENDLFYLLEDLVLIVWLYLFFL